MIHIYNSLIEVTTKLNNLNREYSNNNYYSLPKVPEFISLIIKRKTSMFPDIIESDDEITIERLVTSNTGNFNPVYVCVAKGIKSPIVDKISIMVDYKGNHGPGIATVVIVPNSIFDKLTHPVYVAEILKDVFFSILQFDNNMSYKASPDMIEFYNNNKLNIPLYDIEMIIVAICCINVIITEWFEESNDTVYALEAFSENEISINTKSKVHYILNKYDTISNIRNGIANGKIISGLIQSSVQDNKE